jgi:succinylarginine dihydrolase
MKTVEVNFDGLVGPTHGYSGLSLGNMASEKNVKRISNPRLAALQGLKKMKLLQELGIAQGIFPPHERPYLPALRQLGFTGRDEKILIDTFKVSPKLFWDVFAASSMWTANAATVAPSADTQDNLVHFTPANLHTFFHRSLESSMTHKILEKIFSNKECFKVHDPLPSHDNFSDEGAANHHRFCSQYGSLGAHLFVYGRSAADKEIFFNQRYPARQTLEASRAIARLHQLEPTQCFFARQNPEAIQQGVFHHDVISVGNENVFLYHEKAFADLENFLEFFQKKLNQDFYFFPVLSKQLSLSDAVQSYLFNSQIVTVSPGHMALIAPGESQEGPAKAVLTAILAADNPIKTLHFVDCHQSMLNGGGPACLRLRVVLTEAELKACKPSVMLDDILYERLVKWVEKHYRDRLSHEDLHDPHLLQESYTALDELTQMLELGALYNFQQA